jgi:hypothetical protein
MPLSARSNSPRILLLVLLGSEAEHILILPDIRNYLPSDTASSPRRLESIMCEDVKEHNFAEVKILQNNVNTGLQYFNCFYLQVFLSCIHKQSEKLEELLQCCEWSDVCILCDCMSHVTFS